MISACRRHFSLQAMKSIPTTTILGHEYEIDSMTNITPAIASRLHCKLLSQPNSPLALLWRRIQRHFDSRHPRVFDFLRHDDPIVTAKQNFDELLIPASHPSRSPNDSYYLNRKTMLRTHMTAHEREVMATGRKSFLLVGDVYRRDQIDCSHMPVFHQLEGVCIFSPDELLSREAEYSHLVGVIEKAIGSQVLQVEHDPKIVKLALADLYVTLHGLMKALFGDASRIRWQETFFPFTQPSTEAEVFYDNRWLEVFGSGILQQQVLHPSVLERDPNAIAWAFGMGLERVAMVLHGISDIRLFWSQDDRFTSQFSSQKEDTVPIKFVPFSKYPPICRDISFYLPTTSDFQPNELYEIIREIAPDLVEAVTLTDEYHDVKINRASMCYRIVYRSMERTLTDNLINKLQSELRERVARQLQVTLR